MDMTAFRKTLQKWNRFPLCLIGECAFPGGAEEQLFNTTHLHSGKHATDFMMWGRGKGRVATAKVGKREEKGKR